MNNSAEEQKEQFSKWAAENLGEKTGIWYSPYLEKLGTLLSQFGIGKDYYDNFFYYLTYKEYENVYIQITEQNEEDIEKILKGKAKQFPKSYATKKSTWLKEYASMGYEAGTRSKPDNYGGIANLGSILRAYLKFLYYTENSQLTYPKKDRKISVQNDQLDDSVNYWVFDLENEFKFWEHCYSEKIIGLGWDFVGDLEHYLSQIEIEKKITERQSSGKRLTNESKALWTFYKEVSPGDILFVKMGSSKLVGRGIVMGDYYFDNVDSKRKHRRKIDWTNTGDWKIEEPVATRTLTSIKSSPDHVLYLENLVNEEKIDVEFNQIDTFKIWLSQQEQPNGELLNDRTINQKIASLKDLEKYFQVNIFGETDTESLKDIKDTVLRDQNYDRYKGVSGSSIDYYIRYVESRPIVEEEYESYTLTDFLNEVFIDETQITRIQSILQNKKNLIFKGAPGVGKTFLADRLAYLMMEEKDDSRIQMIQFHQSYSYEDFIEGFRPKADGEGFELRQGPFIKFARKAARDPERDYFFIIDEINRGNMSKIFGELMVLIETDKRGKSVNLLYSNEKFSVPANLYIIGMMNTADRSLALLDYALRRRFSFYELGPAFENKTFNHYIERLGNPKTMLNVIKVINEMNGTISDELGSGFNIGHSYFVGEGFEVNPDSRIVEVVEYEIIPQLNEYWFDDNEKAFDWAEKLRRAYHDGE
ncbi:AAA family ATPase [Marinilactibacillus psychrotolerans]|uniref:AAA family ATPase n=1 Tax=Marinilactibacillus psychrotolerans TaxID=191770 RepID=UPI003886DAC6